MTPVPPRPHDDPLLARLYRQCKSPCVTFARRLLASSGHNRHLCAFDAEEFYDEAWVIYHNRKEYLRDRDDHVAHLNALIRDRIIDQRRRSQAQKRTAPGTVVELGQAEGYERAADLDGRLGDRDHLRQLLAGVENAADARALLDYELGGLTFAEIGANAGITAEAARRRVHRAKAQARATGASDD